MFIKVINLYQYHEVVPNFLNFKKWGEIAVFSVSSLGDVRFWSINRCRLAAWVDWVKRARKKRQKRGAKERRNLQKFDKSVQKRALLCKKFAEI